MRVKVRVVGRDPEVIELKGDKMKVSDLLRELGLLSEEYIVCLLYTSPSPRDRG